MLINQAKGAVGRHSVSIYIDKQSALAFIFMLCLMSQLNY